MGAEFLHTGVTIPFILLTENADEKTVAEIIEGGTWSCVARSHLDGATLIRTIRNTLAMHSLQQEQQAAEESVGKLEQWADMVMVTDRQGILEYVNPAFEGCGHAEYERRAVGEGTLSTAAGYEALIRFRLRRARLFLTTTWSISKQISSRNLTP